MASLGELVAKMSLDIGQFTGALNKVEQQTAKTMDSIKKEFNSVKGEVLGFIAGIVSVHTAMEQFNKAVENSEALLELSHAFGITVEAADELSLAMKLAGTDMGTLEKQMKQLSSQIIDAQNPASKAAHVFKDMGIAIKDASGQMLPMDEIYKNAIRQLGAIEDPALRAKAATELFAKGSVAALKAVEELDESLALAHKQLDTYGVTSKEVAKGSKDFKDQMTLTQDMISRLFLPVVKAILPVFEDFRRAMGENTKGSVSFAEILGKTLAFAFRVVGSAAIVLVGIFKELWLTGEIVGKILTLHWGEAADLIKALTPKMDENRAATKKALEAMWGYGEAVESTHEPVAAAAVNAKDLKDQLNGAADAAKKAAEAAARLAAKQREETIKLGLEVEKMAKAGEGGSSTGLEESFAKINEYLAKFPGNAETAGKALQYVLDKTGDGAKYMKQYRDELNKADDDLEKYRNELVKTWEDMKKSNENLDDEIKLIGLVGVERDLEISRMRRRHELAVIEEADKRMGAADSVHADNVRTTEEFYNQEEALIRAKHAALDYHDALIELGNTMKGALSSAIDTILNKGAKGFRDLWDSFKAWAFKAIAEVAAYKITVGVLGSAAAGPASAQTNMLSQMVSGAGSSALGNAITGTGSGILAGGIMNVGSAAAYMGAGAGATQAGLLAAQTAAFGAEGTVMTTAALGGSSLMTTLAPIMMAAPYIAIAAAIAYVVYDMVVQKKGGPKSGGFASNETGVARYYTPNDADRSMQKLVDTQSKGFDEIIKSLGGTGSAHFAYGFDVDPKGTAQSRVTAGAFVGGKQVYSALNVDAGRDDASLQAALNTEAKRSLLAALQASDLPVQVAKVLDSVLATTATTADIDAIMATATNAKAMLDVLAKMADPMKGATDALDAANQTALEAWTKQRDALYDLANAAPNTAEGLAAVTQGTQAFYVSTVQLLAGIKQAKQQMDDMFSGTRETIEKAALTPDQQYAREQQRAKDLFTQLGKATDPAEIARIAGQINASINNAFGMLTPEEQKAKATEFLAGLDKVQKLADERMDKSMKAVEEQTKTDRAFLTDKLNKIVEGIAAAGADFKKGADDLTGNGVNVHVAISVEDDRLSTEVSGGGGANIGGGA